MRGFAYAHKPHRNKLAGISVSYDHNNPAVYVKDREERAKRPTPPIRTVYCTICRDPFESSHSQPKYCSEGCRRIGAKSYEPPAKGTGYTTQYGDRQRETLMDVLRDAAAKGESLALKQITARAGMNSTSCVHRHLVKLEAQGRAQRPQKGRPGWTIRRPEWANG